jgi:hypothetical protein
MHKKQTGSKYDTSFSKKNDSIKGIPVKISSDQK